MPPVSPQGDFPANPAHKAGYVLEFDSEFAGPTLDTSQWLPHYLPQWSSRKLSEAQYSFANGQLQLHISEDQAPWNPDFDGELRVSSLQTGCFAGPLGSAVGQHHFNAGLRVREAQPELQLYTPQYGFFETRLKALALPGYMVALWMIGFEEQPDQSAEICICEIFGADVQAQSARIGYGVHPFGDPTMQDEFYQDPFELDATCFHLYAAEWTPTHIDFYVDNVKIRTIQQSPHYPMQLMLSLYELPQQLAAGRQGPWPKTAQVDYVRGYRRIQP